MRVVCVLGMYEGWVGVSAAFSSVDPACLSFFLPALFLPSFP
jgi:hypothetical protein